MGPLKENFHPACLYDYPAGQHCAYKTLEYTKMGAFLGAWASTVEMVAHSRPSTFAAITGRLVYGVVPGAAAAGVFASVACLAGNYTGSDTPWNHTLGAVTSSLIIGARYSSVKIGVGSAIVLGTMAYLNKSLRDEGRHDWGPPGTRCSKEFGSFKHYERQWGPKPTEVQAPEYY